MYMYANVVRPAHGSLGPGFPNLCDLNVATRIDSNFLDAILPMEATISCIGRRASVVCFHYNYKLGLLAG